MALPWTPKVVYNGVTLTLTLPMAYPTPGSRGEGGSRVFSSGVGESFKIRSDELLDVRLRLYLSEWPAVRAWQRWMQDNFGTCDFYPDQADPTVYSCYQHAPAMGEDVRPERDPQYPGAYFVPATLRSTNGTPFDVRMGA